MYLSEEAGSTMRGKLPRATDGVRVLVRENAWPRTSWTALIEAAIAEALRVDACVLIIDSYAFWAQLAEGQENDAAVNQKMLGALVAATNAGLAVVLVHHQRKSGGEGGDAVRGSGAIFGAVDALIEIEKPEGSSGSRFCLDATASAGLAQTPARRQWRSGSAVRRRVRFDGIG